MDRWIELWPDGIFLGVFLAMGLARCGVFHGRAIAVLLPDRRRWAASHEIRVAGVADIVSLFFYNILPMRSLCVAELLAPSS